MNKTLLILIFLLLPGASHAALINGGFETGDFTGWTITDTDNGRTAVQEVVPFDVDGDGTASNAARFSVGKGSSSGPAGGIVLSQTVTFDWTGRLYAEVAVWAELLANPGGLFELMVDDHVWSIWDAGTVAANTTERGQLHAPVLTAGIHDIAIRITRTFPPINGWELSQYVDNVGFDYDPGYTPPSPAPAPGVLLLMTLGLPLLLRSRRKAGAGDGPEK